MTKKVHPNASFKWSPPSSKANVSVSRPCYSKASDNNVTSTSKLEKDNNVVALTVWKKSLLLNCNGFTVFDSYGNIVFRVDNYFAANRAEIVLMDAGGKPLLTVRRKRLSWGDNWLIYEGESTVNHKYSVRKQAGFLTNNKTMSLAQVLISPSRANKHKNNSKLMLYEIEGSYAKRNVTMYNNKRQCVAEIKKKEAQGGVTLGGDVFKLIIVSPNDIDSALAMALVVILLEQMFGS